ncbi:hypothetical protein FHV95_111143 [Streptomyces coelicolor]|nr:hypothetical protein B0E38_00140 [Streptomyces sp. 111WW2]QNR95679.1 Hypothetical protein SLIV_37055 [Streptomyces lividans TK24]QSJ13905.1 Hypothetical protein SLIVDG2_37055 [Streptomyces lividans]REH18516.1 hypothetical protein BX268_0225 [Streptomyces sp. 2221.1]TYP06927.1 hypothetical protein FHV91_112143 [Streptomyces coelicolor]TYP08745.1 hypothetical protein FHV98_114143 [Streptomyces coelicolor A3(2)]SDS30027.1 hypothetical protein SAMN05428941_0227 [Streptomyces sp. 2114.2]
MSDFMVVARTVPRRVSKPSYGRRVRQKSAT